MELAQALNLGAQLAYEGGRLASESDFLKNNNRPGHQTRALRSRLHVEWDQKLGPVPRQRCRQEGAGGRHLVDSRSRRVRQADSP